jgi:hypothetical protein
VRKRPRLHSTPDYARHDRCSARTDPRCDNPTISPEDAEALEQLDQLLKAPEQLNPLLKAPG